MEEEDKDMGKKTLPSWGSGLQRCNPGAISVRGGMERNGEDEMEEEEEGGSSKR